MSRRELLLAYKRGAFGTETLLQRIAALNAVTTLPLAEGQRGLWMLERSANGGYNVPLAFRIRDPLDVEMFRVAWTLTLQDHPLLRATMRMHDGTLVQRIVPPRELPFERLDVSAWTESHIEQHLLAVAKRTISLQDGSLASLHLLSRDSRDHVVLLVAHHIVFDGGSVEPLVGHLLDTYDALCRGVPMAQAPDGSFADFVAWEQAYLASDRAAADKAYWLRRLDGPLPRLEVPADRSRATRTSMAGRTHAQAVSEALASRVHRVSGTLKVNPSVIFLAVYKLLLHRYTGEVDLIVGVPTFGRPEPRFESVVGLFTNPIALRSRIDPAQGFTGWARQIQESLLEGSRHAAYPFARLVRDLDLSRDLERTPVFQVAYEYESGGMANVQRLTRRFERTLHIEPVQGPHQEGYYELVCEILESGGQFHVNLKYDGNLFDDSTAERLVAAYMHLLEQVVDYPDAVLGNYSVLPATEQRRLLHDWNDTSADYPRAERVDTLVAAQARRTPDAVALGYDGATLSYAQLEDRVDALTRQLAAHGAQVGSLVGVCVERSLDTTVALLAVLRTGAAYVPLDPAYPPERLRYIVEDCGTRLVVTQTRLLALASDLIPTDATAICLDTGSRAAEAARGPAVTPEFSPDHLAYVIYTSGSTGRPKGVAVSHRSLVNFLWSMREKPGIRADDRMLAVTTCSFDIAALELFLPLVVGARCEICPATDVHDGAALLRRIDEMAPTVMQATPVTWQMLLQAGWRNPSGMKILCGGEALPDALWETFTVNGWDAWNLYGPTETTVWSTVEKVDARRKGSIGAGIANTQLFVLDEEMKPVPALVPGELCIGGDGLARGYLNQAALSAEKFVAHPLAPGGFVYRTGDLARWRADGWLEYLGRRDTQTKVRGYRIELGEIEAVLAAHPGIAECAVLVAAHRGMRQLVAFHVPVAGAPPADATSLRDHLRQMLASYMVPSRFIDVDALPLTPNRKVDRKRLTQMAERSAADERSPGSPILGEVGIEDAMASIREAWRDVLGTSQFGDDDGFFDVGGDSVSAMMLVEQIAVRFGCEVPVIDVFRLGSIRRLAGDVSAKATRAPQPTAAVPPVRRPNDVPVVGAPAPATLPPTQSDVADCVAIIGMSCRFPGATDHEAFWENLLGGVESLDAVPATDAADTRTARGYVAAWGNIEGKDRFDAEFFRVAPHDAYRMDPQLRLLLQHAWSAVEDAGYVPADIPDTGVFTASSHSDYAGLLAAGMPAPDGIVSDAAQYVSWLMSQSGTIPTMISHRLGLTGPSLAVHSNCSSSLVAMHTAFRSLLAGDARHALVGAATVGGTTIRGYMHQEGLNFSRDGRVRTFDATADGMVGGEGVAALLLKRADLAIADGDHIYALLRGIAINNDGAQKAGFYAPSVDGQEKLIHGLLTSTGIHPESIGYVEAHGTGTTLGDPVEVAALTSAYRRFTPKVGFCGIGSVKTNVGHLDAAAGLAGCIKVALSLSRGQLPASLNYREPNPRLNLDDSPFHVVDSHRAWPAGSTPRRAALNSLGIGGTNAHAVFEAYDTIPAVSAKAGPYVVIFSARERAQVRSAATRLLQWLRRRKRDDVHVSLADIAFTLQVGRVAMSCRFATVVDDLASLEAALALYVGGTLPPGNAWEGEVADHTPASRAGTVAAHVAPTREERAALASRWVRGEAVDWRASLPGGRSRRVSLPSYPFREDRFWPETSQATTTGPDVENAPPALHPLVQRNTSTLGGQRFTSRFTGSEHFLRDHVVGGTPVLPGVAYLEMVRVALRESRDVEADVPAALALRNVVWLRPLAVTAAATVHVTLDPLDDGGCDYEVFQSEAAGVKTLHGTGRVVPTAGTDGRAAPVLDLMELHRRCDRRVDVSDLYGQFAAMGIHYGPSHRVVAELHAGTSPNADRYVLARLRLPQAFADTAPVYDLHPSLFDGALQSTLGLVLDAMASPDEPVDTRPHLPFAIDDMEMFAPLPAEAWAHVHVQQGTAASELRKYDLDICDDTGRVHVRLRGFASRVFEGRPEPSVAVETTADDAEAGLMLVPRWDTAVPDWLADPLPAPDDGVMVVGAESVRGRDVANRFPSAVLLPGDAIRDGRWGDALAATGVEHIVWVAPPPVEDEVPASSMLGAFRLIKAVLAKGLGGRPLTWTIVTAGAQAVRAGEAAVPVHAALHGLVGSMAKEYPHWRVRLVDLPSDGDAPLDDILRLPPMPSGDAWAYRTGEWHRLSLLHSEIPAKGPAPWREGGIYVIIGGAGGLGEVLTRHLVSGHRARVVWIGRRAPDAAIEARRNALAKFGPKPDYVQADAGDADALVAAWQDIGRTHGRIDGVIHAAVVLSDRSLAEMDESTFLDVFRAKADSCLALAMACEWQRPGFIAFFSSVQAFSRSPGQGNYAAACAFADAFAANLGARTGMPVRIVDWGYWGSVGVVASAAYRERLADQGIASIEPEDGMAALDAILRSSVPRVAYVRAHASLRDASLRDADRLVAASPGSVFDTGGEPAIAPPAVPEGWDEVTDALRDMEDRIAGRLAVQVGLVPGLSIAGGGKADGPTLRRWLDATTRMLLERGLLEITSGEPRAVAGLVADDVERAWRSSLPGWLADSHTRAHARLAETILVALPEVFAGERSATEVLFPQSSLDLVAGIYRNHPVADHFNAILVASLLSLVEARRRTDPEARLRILEIGAGTGGTSAGVFAALAPHARHVAEYCYTDVSHAFLLYARQYEDAAPYLTRRLFDVERPPAEQGVPTGSFDIVIAANVLHATSDIRRTIRHAKATLREGGALLLNEVSTASLFGHLGFGLLEGWWRYEDPAVRLPDSPGLSPSGWTRVLEDEGFEAIRFPASPWHALGQQVVLARSDGLVREAVRRVPPLPVAADPGDAFPSTPATPGSPSLLRDRAILALRKLVATTLEMPLSRVSASEPMEKYGIDSILVVRICAAMNEVFVDLRTTLFFEHRTVATLVDHLLRERHEKVLRWVGDDGSPAAMDATPRPVAFHAHAAPPVRVGMRGRRPTRGSMAVPADVAIIGLSGRYPGAADVDAFWEQLATGRSGIGEIPAERWDWNAYYDERKGVMGSIYTKWGGFLDGIDLFDPLFFDLSPRQAEHMDPQQRLFLEQAYASIEDAGYTPGNLSSTKKVGVYVGVMNSTYLRVANDWSVANRVSYLFDFHGPSMAVDTACSSSLTAIHLAVEALRNGSCDRAIAGGVNLIVEPVHLQALSAMTMLTGGDRVRAFGDGADGFVDGEGVGAVVLKLLEEAVCDGDHIHGIIRASSLNAGGRTHGYTVPNPVAQAAVVSDALRRAGVHPRTVSYIEAHGTGTQLGDPIEVAALTSAFREGTDDRQYCAIGSVKSNIGHTESAAGIAALTKVLLQMRHAQLAPTLHAEPANPQIDFATGPFVVQHRLGPWLRPEVDVDGERRGYPRIAGISSFGAGGANAHLVVQEYMADDATASTAIAGSLPVLVVLSAKTSDALRDRARLLRAAIVAKRYRDTQLASIAYTLQVGREAMACRLAFTATTIDEMARKLAAFVDGDTRDEEIHAGESTGTQGLDELLAFDDDMRDAIARWMARGKYDKLLALWVKGVAVDWSGLYDSARPPRIPLPTYPFARMRCWIDASSFLSGAATPATGASRLHPWLHENTSTHAGLRFTTRFSGDEHVLADHRVHGRALMPAMAYLDVACAAIAWGAGDGSAAERVSLRHVAWVLPLVADDPVTLHVDVHPPAGDDIGFEIYTEPSPGQRRVHAHGYGRWDGAVPAEQLDMVEWEVGRDRLVDVAACHARLARDGIEYGPYYRGLRAAFSGVDANGDRYVVAHLALPAIAATSGAHVLHPALLDSALHAAAMLDPSTGDGTPWVPHALAGVSIDTAAEDIAFAVLTQATESDANLRRLDVRLCDARGRVRVRLSGLSARRLPPGAGLGNSVPTTVLSTRRWRDAPVLSQSHDGEIRLVLLCSHADDKAAWEELARRLPDDPRTRCESARVAEPEGCDAANRYEHLGWHVIEHVRGLLEGRVRERALVQVVIGDAPEDALSSGIVGLLRSAQLENPLLRGQLISLDTSAGVERWLEALRETATTSDEEIRYRGASRESASLAELPALTGASPYKAGGVYLVTGGLGRLGMLFARDILDHAPRAHVILAARGEPDGETAAQLLAWTNAGHIVDHHRADCADPDDVTRLVNEIERSHGALDGVIHAAGVLRDGFLLAKSRDDYLAVLRAKVHGVVQLDRAIGARALDFFVTFSSVSGTSGNVGQGDYAAANGFLDAYAADRQARVSRGERHGRTVSIGWPQWEEGGMRLPPLVGEMLRASGRLALTTPDGLAAFRAALACDAAHVHVRRRQGLDASTSPAALVTTALPPPVAMTSRDASRHPAVDRLREAVATQLKIAPAQIDARAPFSRYGVDSILVMQLTAELEKIFGPLPKTLFFEYPTLDALHTYFVETHSDALHRWVVREDVPEPSLAVPRASGFAPAAARAPVEEGSDPGSRIVIVGLEGRFPQAANVEEFWEKLRAGADCVEEVPAERWDVARYFDPRKGEPGKTYGKWGGFIEGVDAFDPLFFGMSPREAELTDPQQRLFLETVWNLLEGCGYTRDGLAARFGGKVGVYVGSMYNRYDGLRQEAGAVSQSLQSAVANRVSHYFGLNGPSVAVDTMCSSFAVALHQACADLRRGDVAMAIAGAVNLSLDGHKFVALSQSQLLGSRAERRAFGDGDGYLPAETVGAVLLKPLRTAERDGDAIWGVVRGSAVNHAGGMQAYSVPNLHAQVEVMREAMRHAAVAPGEVGYVEAAASGSALGDVVEVASIARAMEGQPCAIGSVKSNMGHAEAASGFSQLAKVLLQLRHGERVPTIGSEPPNPNLSLEDTGLHLQRHRESWTRTRRQGREMPRLALINSFGAGGSNASLLVEEYRAVASVAPPRREGAPGPQVIVLSGRTASGRRAVAARLA
ncbi:non-ribosomal peptide synthetase, partial [Xanthomonas arboricola]|uniref:non-ribosomal peptide synthetase n=1 Tax=Xanthomonas arboricola TaxID=56448 RepID=UPI001612A122